MKLRNRLITAMCACVLGALSNGVRAQDAAPAKAAQQAPRAPAVVTSRPAVSPVLAEPTQSDVETRALVEMARRRIASARRRERCARREVKRVRRASAELQAQSRIPIRKRQEALQGAIDRLDDCESFEEPTVTVFALRGADGGCDIGDPLCSDIAVHSDDGTGSAAMQQLVACYGKALERDHMLRGLVEYELTVSRTYPNEVTEVKPRADTVGDAAVAACAKAMLEKQTHIDPMLGETVVGRIDFSR